MEILDTAPDELGSFGNGVQVTEGAAIDLSDFRVATCRGAGILADGTDTRLVLANGSVEGVTTTPNQRTSLGVTAQRDAEVRMNAPVVMLEWELFLEDVLVRE